MKKTFRKSIRINGEEIKSPRFNTHADALRWYNSKLREKLYEKEGLVVPINIRTTLQEYFDGVWYPNRKAKYPPSTHMADKQRFEAYVRPGLGRIPIAKIKQLQIRKVLRDVVDRRGQSIQTRNRVRALLSKLFNDAMNEEQPLRVDNPALNISFDDPRQGRKVPQYIGSEKEILRFLKHAKALSQTHHAYASIALMTGLRRSEMIPLTYDDVDFNNGEIKVSRRFMGAANAIVAGLKSGKDDSRIVVIPDELVEVIENHRRKSDFNSGDDFILVREDGAHFTPRTITTMHDEICKAARVNVTIHALRHTYGRQFVLNGGSTKVLQTILGHANSSTTEIYSKLAGKTVNKFRNTVSFKIGDDDDE